MNEGQKIEELLLSYFAGKNDKEEIIAVNKLVVFVAGNVQSRFIAVFEAASKWMNSENEESVKAVKILGEVLGKVKGISLNGAQKAILTKYFLGLTKHLKLIDSATRAFDLLFTEHILPANASSNEDTESSQAIKASAEAGYRAFIEFLEKGSWLTSNYTQPIRYRIYNCLLHVTKHWIHLCSGSEATFLSLVLNHTEEEMDPRNLFVVLEIWKNVLAKFPLDILKKFCMKVFDNISIYFPITFNNKNKTSIITVGDVSTLLNHCLSHELMVPAFIELIFSKMSEDNESDRVGAIAGLVFLLNSEFHGKSVQHAADLQKIIDRSRTILPDLKEKADMVKIFSLIGKILSKQHRNTKNRLFEYLLDGFLDELVSQIKQKPASSDAHTNVSILKEILELTQGDSSTEIKIASAMWSSIFQLKKSESHVHLKLVLEQYVAVFLKSGIQHHVNQFGKTQTVLESEYFSGPISSGAFDFLLNYAFRSDSFDVRMLGVMAFKLALKHIKFQDHPHELQITKEIILSGIKNREAVESRCLVDFYFELNSFTSTLDKALQDFPQITTLVSHLSQSQSLQDSGFVDSGYVFMSFLNAQSRRSMALGASEQTVIKNLLLGTNRELTNPQLDNKMIESLTYFLKMLHKLNLACLELHKDSGFCTAILGHASRESLTDAKESQQECVGLLEEFLAANLTREEAAQDGVLEQVVNHLLQEVVAKPANLAQIHQRLLLNLVKTTDINLNTELVQRILKFSLDSSEFTSESNYLIEVITTYFLRAKDLRASHSASLQYHSERLRATTDETTYLHCLRILKALLARMDTQAFKDVEFIIEKHTQSTGAQSKIDTEVFQVLFKKLEDPGKLSRARLTTSPLHLQRLFGIYTAKTKHLDRKLLVKSDLLLANQLPLSIIKPQILDYIALVENVIQQYPAVYDKQTLVD